MFAGVLPALRRGALPGSAEWFVVSMVPGSHPFEELEAALRRVAVNPPASLLDQLTSGSTGIGRAVRHVLPDDQSPLLLVIDQFEELFTQTSEETAAVFLDVLAVAVEDPRSQLRVRRDAPGRLLRPAARPSPHRRAAAQRHRGRSPRCQPEELEQAIEGPAARVGVRFEPRPRGRDRRRCGRSQRRLAAVAVRAHRALRPSTRPRDRVRGVSRDGSCFGCARPTGRGALRQPRSRLPVADPAGHAPIAEPRRGRRSHPPSGAAPRAVGPQRSRCRCRARHLRTRPARELRPRPDHARPHRGDRPRSVAVRVGATPRLDRRKSGGGAPATPPRRGGGRVAGVR